jgi:hypothetical protein
VTYLCIWLYANSPESAGRKAYAIAEQLPYTLADPNPVVFAYPSIAADDSELPGLNAEYAVAARTMQKDSGWLSCSSFTRQRVRNRFRALHHHAESRSAYCN